MMAAGNVGDVNQADKIDVFFELGDKVAGRNLLVEKIVEEFHMGITDGTDNVKTFGGLSEGILGIFFRVDVFDEERDVVFGGDLSATLEGFDAVGVHFRGREARNFVPGLHNEAGAFEFVHGGNNFAQGFEKVIAFAGVGQRNPYAAGTVNLDAEFAFFAARLGKIFFFPIL